MLRRGRLAGSGVLFIAFAFTVMADPVSSIAYAIEAALRKLDGNWATSSSPCSWSARRSR